MNSTQIQCFMEAAQCLNFTAAAEKLFISQPALSRNISALEDELEILLFVRRNNVLSLTAGGEVVYEWMRGTRDAFSAMLAHARRANAEEKNELRLGFLRSEAPSRRDAETIARFKQQHPDVSVEIVNFDAARELIRHLTEHAIDIALMIGSAAYGDQRLQYLELSRYRRCIAVSVLHPFAGRSRASLREFSNDCFVSITPDSSPTMTAMVKRVCGSANYVPRIIEASGVPEQVSWVESNKGVALVVDNHAERHNPLLRFIELEEVFPVNIICVWDRLNANPNIAEFTSAMGGPA